MKTFKKCIVLLLAAALVLSTLAACGNNNTDNENGSADAPVASNEQNKPAAPEFDSSQAIGVISREDGSGTRGAFIELFGVEQKNEAGEKIDHTTQSAVITDSTSVMMTTVAGDKYAIGYISMGSLNNTVKAVRIDGAEASVEAIKAGSYKIARPFNIATKEGLSEAAQDFINYILSADGQAVIEANGCIAVSDAGAYSGSVSSGKIVISGSSSVTPVMEKLKEAYLAVNPGVEIELQQSDSSTGMSDAIEGVCDIGMASRALKDSEVEKGLTGTTIAMDGIAVIVNNDCPIEELTSEQVKNIFTGEATVWSQILGQ